MARDSVPEKNVRLPPSATLDGRAQRHDDVVEVAWLHVGKEFRDGRGVHGVDCGDLDIVAATKFCGGGVKLGLGARDQRDTPAQRKHSRRGGLSHASAAAEDGGAGAGEG